VLALTVPVAAMVAADQRGKPTNLVALFTGLDEYNASSVRKRLEEQRVPFELRDGGQTIMVPADHSAELTIELSRFAPAASMAPVGIVHGMDRGQESALRGAASTTFRTGVSPAAQGHGGP
jgi:hypothetical protein